MRRDAEHETEVDDDPAIAAQPELRKLHPLTPILASWRPAGIAIAVALGIFRDDLDRLRWVWDALHGDVALATLGIALAIIIVIGVISVVAAWLSWRVTGFAIVSDNGPATLLLHRGLVVRSRRQVRLARVQSVDVNQPFIARLFGLAVVRLDMAAGDDASADLAYLTADEAWRLRDEILRYTGSASDRSSETPGFTADRMVARVSLARLIKASLLEGVGYWVLTICYVVGVIVVGVVFGGAALLAGIGFFLPIALALAADVRRRVLSVLRDAHFTLTRTPTGVRVSAGLTSTTNRSVALDRIQGIRLEEPFLWRKLGWARVTVDVAGSVADKHDKSGAGANSLLPVGGRAEAIALIEAVVGANVEPPDVTGPGPRARWLDPWGFRFLGVALMDGGALSVHGRVRRTHAYVPYARVQSVSAHQGMMQRACQVATVWLDVPTGGQRWGGKHQDEASAAALVEQLSARARHHRLPVRRPPTDRLPSETPILVSGVAGGPNAATNAPSVGP
ncbi:MAG: PH domain-containing protein [Nocardioidaceae bacterium]